MSKLLILMRHAKAVDRLEAEDDFQRGLTQRGRDDSARAGETLAAAGLEVDLALVSPAWRTRQTYDRLLPALGNPVLDDPMALYHASTEMLERAVLDGFSRQDRILVVGHNPGIGGFAHKLAMAAGKSRELPAGYPTAAAAAYLFDDEPFEAPRLVQVFNPKA